jgi:hypothetical protein
MVGYDYNTMNTIDTMENLHHTPQTNLNPTTPPTQGTTSTKKQCKPRCHFCHKKLKMTELTFICKCEHTFCQHHLNPHSHTCGFNYLQERRDIIQEKNPKMCIQSLEVT